MTATLLRCVFKEPTVSGPMYVGRSIYSLWVCGCVRWVCMDMCGWMCDNTGCVCV